MTILKGLPTLHDSRIQIDRPVKARDISDIMATVNAQYEMILDRSCPGSNLRSLRGHVHDHEGQGKGILRVTDGGFYFVDLDTSGGMSLTVSSSSTPYSMATSYSGDYVASGSNYVMGVAYVSPGIEAIRCEVQMEVSSGGLGGQVRINNLTDSQTSAWTNVTTNPTWIMTQPVTVTPAGDGGMKRVEIDIEVWTLAAGTETFHIWAAYPYEHTDAPDK